MNPKRFFAELKRRNVYRAAVLYGMSAWLLAQITTQIFPFFNVPNSAVRFVIIALVLGFPIAMALAWIYELTPAGFVRTEDVDVVTQRQFGRRFHFVIIGVLLLVIAMLVYQRLPFRTESGETIPEKSIAVLPFANFSDEKANSFFADGIQDDILTSLAEIKDLRVISRSSVIQFRDVGARNVRHIWANRYDRTLIDSLGLQGELASEIADALRANLSADEKARVAVKPTQNPDAYVFYLRANQISRNPDALLEDYKTAEQLFMQAIALDPDFALAHARLASVRAEIFHYYEPTENWRTKARAEAETALRLQPNLAEAHFALGQCIYWMD